MKLDFSETIWRTFIGLLKISLLKLFLFFNPLLGSGNSLLKLYHLVGNYFLLLNCRLQTL